MTDLLLRLVAEDAASEVFGNAAGAVRKYAGAVFDTMKEAAKAYADAEKIQRQLRFAAGEYTDTLNRQAEAMKRKFAVDDDQIRHLDVLLLRWGAAPAALKPATEAILDYAAATGKDATSAMEQLIRGVEAGTGSLGRMGVHFKATGDFSKDLASAVGALNAKFGGAGEVAAGGLAGQASQVSLAISDLQKTFGAMFDEIDKRYGLLDKVARGLNNINAEIQKEGFKTYFTKPMSAQDTEDLFYGSKAEGQGSRAGRGAGNIGITYGPEYRPDDLLSTKGSGGPKSGKGGSALDAIREAQEMDDRLERQREFNKRWIKQEEEFDLDQEELKEKTLDNTRKKIDESNDLMMKAFEKQEEEHTKDLQKLGELQLNILKDQTKQQEEEADKRMSKWVSIGERIGTALINGIAAAVSDNAKNDKDKVAKILVKTIMAIVDFVFPIAGAFLRGAGKAGTALDESVSHDGQAANLSEWGFHDGGWIPRFHGGGGFLAADERPAILQTGERVLSRREVSRMGGRSGVDSLAGGNGGRSQGGHTFNVYAFDAQSLLEKFGGGSAERALINAVRTNSGNMRSLLGAG